MVAYTAHYLLPKPTVGADDDAWGTYQDTAFDLIDAALWGKLDLAGGTMTGVLVATTPAAGAGGYASFRLPHGAAPTTNLTNGDVWSTTAGIFARINGATKTVAFLEGAAFTGNISTTGTATATGGVIGALTGNVTGNVTGNLTGTASAATLAASATVLATTRAFAGTGDVTIGSQNFDGSAAVNFTTTVGNNKITNAMLVQVATASFLGRTTVGTGNVETLTATQATALLNAVVGDSGGGGTKGLVPAATAGDAAALKTLLASGVFGFPTAKSGAASGWEISIGDIRIKGGSYAGTNSSIAISFANAFPNACLGAYVTPFGYSASTQTGTRTVPAFGLDPASITTSGFSGYLSYEEETGDVFLPNGVAVNAGAGGGLLWVAIGY